MQDVPWFPLFVLIEQVNVFFEKNKLIYVGSDQKYFSSLLVEIERFSRRENLEVYRSFLLERILSK